MVGSLSSLVAVDDELSTADEEGSGFFALELAAAVDAEVKADVEGWPAVVEDWTEADVSESTVVRRLLTVVL